MATKPYAPVTSGITAKLEARLQREFNAHCDHANRPDASLSERAEPFQTRLTSAEARAAIAALRYVLLAAGYTR